MPKKPPAHDKIAASKKTVTFPVEPRVLPFPKKIWFKPWTWRSNLPAPPRTPLPKARVLLVRSVRQLVVRWKLFGGIIAFYGVLNLIFVRGFSDNSGLGSFKELLDSALTGRFGAIQSSFSSFAYLLTTSGGGATATSGTYQSVLLIVASLALIWALRQTTAKHSPRIRDAFYRGMYPLVPFLLVLLVMTIQLVPLLIGSTLYSLAVNTGVASDLGQKLIFALVFVFLGLWSAYMIAASAFALYIVTLPDMTPLKALRSAKQLVYKRRLLVWRKLIFLPIVLLLAAVVIELPLIWLLTPAAVWAFFVFSMVSVAFVHGYLYTLYRELL